MKKKKIGLYLINYNYADFLLWAMRSIQAQTRQPDVILFTDDCSTDNSLKVMNEEIKRNKEYWKDTIVMIHKDNEGAVKTMNEAVDYLIKMECDYIMGLSADDVLHKDYLKETAKALDKAPKNVGYVYTWVRRFGDENSIDKHIEFDSEVLMRRNFVHGSALIKASVWQGLPLVKVCEDWEMYKSLARRGIIGRLIPKPLLLWRKHNKGCRTQGNRGK